MDARQNPNGQQPPDTNPGAEAAAPPKARVSSQYVVIGIVLGISVATTFAMRKWGMGEGVQFRNTQVSLDQTTPIVDNAKFGRVMDRLATSNTPMQVPFEKIDKNPFLLTREGVAIAEVPVTDDSAERAAQEAERLRQEAERRVADLQIAFARLTLNTVMTGGRVPVARINNQIVGVGEVVEESFTVVAITSEGVELEAEGHTFRLETNSMVNPRNAGPGSRTPQPTSSSRTPPRRP
ncbi:MAG: hypothetical protein IT200_18190 [Thermoleophilia bacterium]|nr:hypothetical protein [Thermoleophilia bacterium]